MSIKKRLLFYTDCFIFGGCENVLANALSSQELREAFEMTLAHRKTSEYERGAKKRLPADIRRTALPILANETLFYRLDLSGLPRWLKRLVKSPFFFLEFIGLYAAWNLWVLTIFFSRSKPDILHINNGGYPAAESCLTAVVAARIARVPAVVLMVNNLAYNRRGVRAKFIDFLVTRYASAFLTASEAALSRLQAVLGTTQARFASIPNTLVLPKNLSKKDVLREELGLPANAVVICGVGLLTARKGFHVLVAALDPEELQRQNAFAVIFGDGEERAALENLRDRRGLKGRVFFPGFRPNVFDYLACSDLLVLPSTGQEDFPYVIIEAMALGKAVIGTRVAGIPEQIDHGLTGMTVQPGNSVEIANALAYLLREPSIRNKMGERGLEKFLREYQYQHVMMRFVQFYSSLLSETESMRPNLSFKKA